MFKIYVLFTSNVHSFVLLKVKNNYTYLHVSVKYKKSSPICFYAFLQSSRLLNVDHKYMPKMSLFLLRLMALYDLAPKKKMSNI